MLYHPCKSSHPAICNGCTTDETKHGQVVPMFVDKCGNNYSKIGQIYRNGELWWQRVE